MAYYHSFLLFSFIIISLSKGGSGNFKRARPIELTTYLIDTNVSVGLWGLVLSCPRNWFRQLYDYYLTQSQRYPLKSPPVEELHLYLSTAIYQNNIIVFILCLGWALAGYWCFPVWLHNVLLLNLTLHTYLPTRVHCTVIKYVVIMHNTSMNSTVGRRSNFTPRSFDWEKKVEECLSSCTAWLVSSYFLHYTSTE